jgi:hypothetical protein
LLQCFVVCALKGWNFEAGGAGDRQKGARSTKGDPFDFSLAPARPPLSYVEYTISHITMVTGHEGCAASHIVGRTDNAMIKNCLDESANQFA